MLSCQFNRQQVSVINCRKTSTVLMAHLLRSFAFGGAKKKPLALWIYGRISVFYFHSIKPVRIEFRNVTICFFFGNPKWIWWRKSTTQCTEVFTDLLNFWFERLVSIVYFFFSNSHTCKHWVDIYSKLQNPENKVISIKHLMAEKLQRNKHHRTFSEEVKAYRLRSIFFFSCL